MKSGNLYFILLSEIFRFIYSRLHILTIAEILGIFVLFIFVIFLFCFF